MSIRRAFSVLLVLALMALTFVLACHKKEGSDQSRAGVVPAVQTEVVSPGTSTAPPQELSRGGEPRVQPGKVPAVAVAGAQPVGGVKPSTSTIKRPAPKAAPRQMPISSEAAGWAAAPETPAVPGTEPQGPRLTVEDFPPAQSGGVIDLSQLPPSDVTTFQRPKFHKPSGLKEKLHRRYPNVNLPVQFGDRGKPSSIVPKDMSEAAPGTEAAPVPGNAGFMDHTFNGDAPPDADMAVGATHIVTDYNAYLRIFDKTGTKIGADVSLVNLFTGLTNCGAAESTNNFLADPQAVYDDQNDRFVVTALRVALTTSPQGQITAQSSYLCLACTQTGNPTGTWNRYQVNMPTSILADYPHTGIGEDAVFIGVNDFDLDGYIGSSIWALSKSQIYNNQTLTSTRRTFSADLYTPQPAERRGYATGQYPPAGSPHYFMATDNDTGGGFIWRWPQPTFTSNASQWGTAILLTYPGTTVNPSEAAYTTAAIDALDYRFMDAELRWPKLYTARAGASGGYDFIQWAELDLSGASPAVGQSGQYAPAAGTHAWTPDVVVDKHYNFAVGYTKASATGPVLVGAYLTGRENNSTSPPNALEADLTAHAGELIFTGTDGDPGADVLYRWGDYLGLSPDPNGCDFWFNGAYSANNALADKTATWVRKYSFASCSGGATARAATLGKGRYFCQDTVTATILDTGGAPSNVVFHSTSGGSVPTTASGTGPLYTVAPKTITELGAQDADEIYLTFTGSDAATYSSSKAVVDCSLQVCVYTVDPLAGGCDDDIYHDQGETLNYWVGIANYETFPLPGPFTADLVLRTPDSNVDILVGQGTFPAIDSETFDYAQIPFAVKYSGAIASQCKVPLQFRITNIQSVDGGWTAAGCPVGSENFDETANADDNPQAAYFTEAFTSAPPALPAGWASTVVADVNTGANAAPTWVTRNGTLHPAGGGNHSNPYLAIFNSWTADAGDIIRLYRTSGTDTSGAGKLFLTYWMFHDTQYTNQDYIQVQTSTDGTTWVDRGLPIYRYDGTGVQAWKKHDVDISAVAGQTSVQVALLGVGDYGNDEHVDDIVLAPVSYDCENTVCTPAASLAYDFWTFEDASCNADEWLDPNEVGPLNVYVTNGGNDWALDVVGTLTCPSCPAGWGSICDNTANYEDIPYGTPYGYGPATDKFQIALGATVPSGTVLPFKVTLQGSNYGPVTIDTPLTLDTGAVFVGTEYRYEDHFEQADPDGTAPWDRVGFSSPGWTEDADNRVVGNFSMPSTCTGTDGDGAAAQITSANSFYRLFPTTGATGTLTLHVEMRLDDVVSSRSSLLQYTTNGGTAWTTLRTIVGPGTGATGVWNCYDINLATEVPASLNNANFGIKFLGANGGTTYVDNFKLVGTATHATSCTGSCPPQCQTPGTLTNNGATDLGALADTGVQVTWAQDAGNWGDGGTGTRTYDVLRGGTPIQSGIAYGTTTYTDTTGVNGTSYTYAVRYNNGCGQNATTTGASAADWVDPGETAATGLTWLAGSKTQIDWTANAGATLYNLYRGTKADLPNLLTSSNDSCTRYTGATASATGIGESNGSAGDFYWFLVTGVNGGGGEGSAGTATAGPRVVNSTGTCP